MTEQKIERLIRLLSAEYGDPDLCNQRDPIDETVLIILSEKTDESKYLSTFRLLRERFRSWEELVSAEQSELERLIAPAGMGKRRARLLKECLAAIIGHFGSLDLSALSGMAMEAAEAELTRLPGVGRKAARCILLFCFDMPALPVDIHTYRLAVRLGLLPRAVTYEESHLILPPLIPPSLRKRFHVNAVAHGRKRCFSARPDCVGCPVCEACSDAVAVWPIRITSRPVPLAIDLFAGAGGLSEGFRRAGFQIALAVEQSPHAARTYSLNHPNTYVVQEDITQLDPLDCLRRIGLRPGDVTAVIGGPPCQGFSDSNRRTRTVRNPQNHLYREFVRFVAAIQPEWFVLENVPGMKTMEKGAFLERIIDGCTELGYEVLHARLNASDYGVPQVRRRVFVIGNRNGLPVGFPSPSHGTPERPYVTVKEAISDLPTLENGVDIDYLEYGEPTEQLSDYQMKMRGGKVAPNLVQGNLVSRNAPTVLARYAFVHEGGNWTAIPRELMANYEDVGRCHTGIYHRLRWDVPSKVIGNFRKNMLIHPSQDRGLSVREVARLQSFPDGYRFLGSIGFQQQQVADAVPPKLAEALASRMLNCKHAGKRSPRSEARSIFKKG